MSAARVGRHFFWSLRRLLAGRWCLMCAMIDAHEAPRAPPRLTDAHLSRRARSVPSGVRPSREVGRPTNVFCRFGPRARPREHSFARRDCACTVGSTSRHAIVVGATSKPGTAPRRAQPHTGGANVAALIFSFFLFAARHANIASRFGCIVRALWCACMSFALTV